MAILNDDEFTEFESRVYGNPQVSLDESNAFIDNLRQTQQTNNQQINTDTYNKKEKWADINGSNGKYKVSNFGRVMSMFNGKQKILKPWMTTGYPTVSLGKNDKRLVHRLVAEAFIKKQDGKTQVNHKNGNRSDNRVDNLEWVSSKENIIHGRRVLGHCLTPIIQCSMSGEELKVWRGIYEACEALGVKSPNIVGVANGRKKSAGGFLWKYTMEGRR